MIENPRGRLLAITAGLTLTSASLDTIRARAPGIVVKDETIDPKGRPVSGGLVDPSLFGEAGDRFARIVLVEPVQHPLMIEKESLLRELPVLPPALRPPSAHPLSRSPLDLLYVGVLGRNHRLAKALRLGGPESLLNQERHQLSRAILRLFANREVADPRLGLNDEPLFALLDLMTQADPERKRDILFALALEAS